MCVKSGNPVLRCTLQHARSTFRSSAVHRHRRPDLAERSPALRGRVADEALGNLFLGLLCDFRRVRGLRPEPAGRDDVHLGARSNRPQVVDVVTEIPAFLRSRCS